MSDLNRKLFWLIAIRLLIVVSFTVLYALYNVGQVAEGQVAESDFSSRMGVALPLIGVVSVLTLIYLALRRWWLRDRPKIHAYAQFVGDLALVTFLIYKLDGTGQSFSILYFVVISLASVLVRRSAGIVIATLAGLFFTVMAAPPSLDWLPGGWELPRSSFVGLRPPDLAYTVVVHLGGFYAVAFLTSYLARDVTRAEADLRARSQDLASLRVQHRDVIESISSGLVTIDLSGRVTTLNHACASIFERAAEDLVGQHITQSVLFDAEHWAELTEGSGETSRRLEINRRRAGATVCLGVTASPLRDGQSRHRGYILVIEDMTERRRLQSELRVKDRMAAIGEMAAGLAHEVGNPLAAISGSVQVLSQSFEGGASQHKLLEILLKESRRLDRTVKSFMQLASSRERRFVDVDIALLIAEGIELLRLSDEVGEHHRIDADLDPPSAVIRADPDQVGQIFWNLARNALHAMPEGGELNVTGRLVEDRYHLAFRDTGDGMIEEERANLFQPFKSFFDQGTGLGLAIVYRIVEEHGGKIAAESEPGAWTRILVELPVAGPSERDTAEEEA